MSFLEEKIKDNRAFFDDKEPGLGHKGRFLGKLDHHEVPETRLGRWFAMMKIAAIALLFITASYFIFKFSIQDLSGAMMRGVTQINLSEDIENVFDYYESRTSSKIEKIGELAFNDSEAQHVKTIALKQLESLDASLAKIEKEYAKNPNNKVLYAALVNNKRKKAEIMDNIIKQLDNANQSIEVKNLMNP